LLLESRINELNEAIKHLNNQISNIKSENERNLFDKNIEIDKLRAKVKDLEKDITTLIKEMENRKKEANEKIKMLRSIFK